MHSFALTHAINIELRQLSVSSGVVTTYSATLIKNLGYAPKKAALMNMPSGVVSIFFTLLVGFGVRKQSHRWAWIIACIIPAYVSSSSLESQVYLLTLCSILGGALMSFLDTKTHHAGVLAGIYLVNAVVAPLTLFYAVSSSPSPSTSTQPVLQRLTKRI